MHTIYLLEPMASCDGHTSPFLLPFPKKTRRSLPENATEIEAHGMSEDGTSANLIPDRGWLPLSPSAKRIHPSPPPKSNSTPPWSYGPMVPMVSMECGEKFPSKTPYGFSHHLGLFFGGAWELPNQPNHWILMGWLPWRSSLTSLAVGCSSL